MDQLLALYQRHPRGDGGGDFGTAELLLAAEVFAIGSAALKVGPLATLAIALLCHGAAHAGQLLELARDIMKKAWELLLPQRIYFTPRVNTHGVQLDADIESGVYPDLV